MGNIVHIQAPLNTRISFSFYQLKEGNTYTLAGEEYAHRIQNLIPRPADIGINGNNQFVLVLAPIGFQITDLLGQPTRAVEAIAPDGLILIGYLLTKGDYLCKFNGTPEGGTRIFRSGVASMSYRRFSEPPLELTISD